MTMVKNNQVDKRLLDRDGTPAPRVLLVEDDLSVISSLQRNFRPYRLELQVAFHGFHGLSEALAFKPKLLITDLQMPMADGEELIQCLAHISQTREVPIIIVTGRPGVTLTRKLKSQGVCMVLAKPIPFPALLSEMAKKIPITRFDGAACDINEGLKASRSWS
jgi:CheY-like chemotaxis protein